MAPYLTPEKETSLIAVDECSVRLETRLRKVVAEKGSKPVITSEKTYSKGVSIIGGITGTRMLIWDVIEARANTEHFMNFLDTVNGNYGRFFPEEELNMIVDNALYHHSKKTKKKAKDLKINLHFQPSHSPFLNAAEEIWRQLREFLRCRLFKTIELLREAITEFFVINNTLNINVASYLT